jgi:hypothetical protein
LRIQAAFFAMASAIRIPNPELQALFGAELLRARRLFLMEALQQTVRELSIPAIDDDLRKLASGPALRVLASKGLRGELVFPTPTVLLANPRLLGYYRLLLGFSQKVFYSSQFGLIAFKGLETKGTISDAVKPQIAALCHAFASPSAYLLSKIDANLLSQSLLHDLSLLSLGPQLRGGANNRIGQLAIQEVFELIREILESRAVTVSEQTIEVRNAAGRTVYVQFAPDPDIIIRETMGDGNFRNILAIEVKGGADVSNIHNRLGEAEKSHQKARQGGYCECWTVVNVARLDSSLARTESPSTNRFYNLSELTPRAGDVFSDFNHRIRALIGII